MLNVSIQKSVLPQNLRKGIIFPLHAQDVKIDSLPVNSQTPVPPTAVANIPTFSQTAKHQIIILINFSHFCNHKAQIDDEKPALC